MKKHKNIATLLTSLLLAEAAKACRVGVAQFRAIAKSINLQPQ